MISPWEELGIAPTTDASVIRKAYAVRLRQTRPDEDPQGFARLRAAYEAALQMASRSAAPQPPHPPQPEPKPEPPRADPPPPPTPNRAIIRPVDDEPQPVGGRPAPDASLLELPPGGEEAVRKIVDALNRKANFEAARLLYSACESHLLPLRSEFQLKDRLALALSTDGELRTTQLQEIAGRFGWHSASIVPRGQADSPQARLAARIERELAAERAEKLAAQPPPKPAPAPKPSGGGGFRYGWLGFVLFVLMAFVRGISDHDQSSQPTYQYQPPLAVATPLAMPPAPAPNRPVDCHGSLSSMSIDTLKQCAASGVSSAQSALGFVYYKGDKLPQDYAQAVALFRDAADQGDAEARRNLAYMHRMGYGTPKDLAATRQLYLTGAQQGDVIAQSLLGNMMLRGEGGPTDAVQGFGWVKKAALGLNIPSMAELGYLYESGTGTPRNAAKAAAWWQSAAEAGNSNAMLSYGQMLLGGKGVPADRSEAYRWLSLAARDSNTAAGARSALASPALRQLTAQQRAAIDAAVTQWQPAHPMLPLLFEQ